VHYADTENSFIMVNLALDIAQKLLKPGGCFVAKVFEGAEYQTLLKRARSMFEFAKSFNPKASLTRSRNCSWLHAISKNKFAFYCAK